MIRIHEGIRCFCALEVNLAEMWRMRCCLSVTDRVWQPWPNTKKERSRRESAEDCEHWQLPLHLPTNAMRAYTCLTRSTLFEQSHDVHDCNAEKIRVAHFDFTNDLNQARKSGLWSSYVPRRDIVPSTYYLYSLHQIGNYRWSMAPARTNQAGPVGRRRYQILRGGLWYSAKNARPFQNRIA